MGWNSANEIFDPVAHKLIELDISDGVTTEVLTVLIKTLLDGDWDTPGESLDEFKADNAIVEAFRRNGIWEQCEDTKVTPGNWDECALEVHHEGLHQDWTGKVQW